MQRAQALGKTLILGKIEGRRRRGWQRVSWLDGITDSMDMNLRKLQERVKDRQAYHAAIPGVAKSHWTTRTTGRIPHALGQLSSEATTNEPACPRACALQQEKCGEVKVALSCPTDLGPHGLYSPWNFPGQNAGVGSLSLLQGIFQTQGSNPGLLHCRRILYQLSQKESPRILEWVVYPFSRRYTQPRNWTGVSCIAGGFFINWAIR